MLSGGTSAMRLDGGRLPSAVITKKFSSWVEVGGPALAADGWPNIAAVVAANTQQRRRSFTISHARMCPQAIRQLKGILNKLTPEKFDRLLQQLLGVITTADILRQTIALVFENAVEQPTYCAMYADLCLQLSKELPSFPPPPGGDRPVTFVQILLNTCQDEFEGAEEARMVRQWETGGHHGRALKGTSVKGQTNCLSQRVWQREGRGTGLHLHDLGYGRGLGRHRQVGTACVLSYGRKQLEH